MLARQCREPLCDCRSQRDRIFRGHLHLHEVATRDEGEVRGRLDAEGLERRHPSYQAKSTQDVVHVFQLLRHGGALVVHECELVCDRVCGSGARVRRQEEEEEGGEEEEGHLQEMATKVVAARVKLLRCQGFLLRVRRHVL